MPLDAIVGTVDRTREFDRSFRPVSPRLRSRWERIAAAQRRGESLPPISVYKIGDLYFVRDGHHRVSVARSLGRPDIDAYVTEVKTRLGRARTSAPPTCRSRTTSGSSASGSRSTPRRARRIRLRDPWDWPVLAEAVEAWGMRAMQDRGTYMDRGEVARLWFDEEYPPVTEMLREGGLLEPDETEADAYMRIADARYQLLRTHEWSDRVLEELRDADRRRRRRRRLPPRRRGRRPLR